MEDTDKALLTYRNVRSKPLIGTTDILNKQAIVLGKTFAVRKTVFAAAVIAVLQFTVHLFAVRNYGFHRDELLHLAMTDHLAAGYKEVPPFIAMLGRFSISLLGSSMAAVRFIPELCSALLVFFTGMLAIRMGGRMPAVIIACLAITLSPAFLTSGYLFTPVVFDQLWWVIAAHLLLGWVKNKDPRCLLLFGITAGMGMLTKYTMAFYVISLLAGMVVHKRTRTLFVQRYFWEGIAIALLMFLPNLVWQFQHGIPFFTHMKELRQTQLIYIQPLDFMVQQLLVNSTLILVWLPGLAALFSFRYLKKYRFMAWAFLLVMLILVVLKGKIYYGFGAYPPLFAAGAVFWEYHLRRRTAAWTKWGLAVVCILPNLVFAPLVMPFLPIQQAVISCAWLENKLNIRFPLKWEDQQYHDINQNFADMLGWDELALKTARLYHSLPAAEQQQTLILAANYGTAGAIDYYGKQYRLPRVVSLSSSFALWAPPSLHAKQVIYIDRKADFTFMAGSIKKYGDVQNRYAVEKGTGIFLLSGLKPQFNNWYRHEWLKRHK